MARFLRANGKTVHYAYRAGGSSRPIVFANSLGTDLRIWDEVIARLPADLPVLTYDKSGHGLSSGGSATITQFAEDLAALLDELGLRDVLLCGVSVGGMIAQQLAALRRDLVAGMVLSNTAHRIGDRDGWNARIAALDATGLGPMGDRLIERWFAERYRSGFPTETEGYRTMLVRTPPEGYRAVCAAIRDADLTEVARALRCPVLCIAGSDDLATPPDRVQALADLIPGAELRVLPDVGHLPCIEAPDQLARHIGTFHGGLR